MINNLNSQSKMDCNYEYYKSYIHKIKGEFFNADKYLLLTIKNNPLEY